MSQPSPDAKAVVRAAEALTTQVRRIADAMETPVVRYEVATDDVPTTPATECSAQYHGDGYSTECIRAAQHPGVHVDTKGFSWSEKYAVYPTDSTVRVAHWHPLAEQLAEERQELAGMVGEFIDAQVQHARAADEAACRRMETRTCPRSYNGPCGDRPCARFESDDPAPWLDPAETPYAGATTTPKAAPAADEETLRLLRRESLLVLLTRLQRGRTLSEEEAGTLRHHVETEIKEANVGREEASYYQQLSAEQGQAVSRAVEARAAAQAAIERVRNYLAELEGAGWSQAAIARRIRAALDDTEQPEPPARNFAAYQAAIARVALVLREAREHREQTDPSERQDCIMCGADHFAEIRDAIKGKQPTTEGP